jgi:hypothetical protein
VVSPTKNFRRPHLKQIGEHSGAHLSSHTLQENVIRRMSLSGHLEQKKKKRLHKTPISTDKSRAWCPVFVVTAQTGSKK